MSNAAVMFGPTVQRLRHVQGNDVVMPTVSRQEVRRAWRIVSPVESLRNAGKISYELWAAFDTFDTDWHKSAAQPNLIARYGERAGSGGTPLKHMTSDVIEAADDRDEYRAAAANRVRVALAAIVVPRMQRALLMAVQGEGGLEEIGRTISRYTDRGKAIAVAAMALEDALCLLRHHYQTLHAQSQPVP